MERNSNELKTGQLAWESTSKSIYFCELHDAKGISSSADLYSVR